MVSLDLVTGSHVFCRDSTFAACSGECRSGQAEREPISGCGELLVETLHEESMERQRRACGNGDRADDEQGYQQRDDLEPQASPAQSQPAVPSKWSCMLVWLSELRESGRIA